MSERERDKALSIYLSQEANWGADDLATRQAEADAFTAGWQAACRYLLGLPEAHDCDGDLEPPVGPAALPACCAHVSAR